jgi:hypothetical protein
MLLKTVSTEKNRFKNNGLYKIRPLKKRCRVLPAGGLGVFPQLRKSPKIGGIGG